MTTISDYELLYMIRQGDEDAFVLLFKRYDECICHLVYHFIRYDIARRNKEDFYQLAAMKMLQAIDAFREDKQVSFRIFFQKVFRRALIDFLRVNKDILLIQGYGNLFDHAVCDAEGQYTTNISKIEPDQSDAFRRYEEAIIHLSDFEKRIVELRKDQYTYPEIAKIMHTSKYMVEKTMRKIRKVKKKE